MISSFYAILRQCIWIFPFLCFFIGYISVRYFYIPHQQITPQLIGLHLHEGFQQLSSQNLHLALLSEKIEPGLPTGTILWQTPSAGQKIKSQQTVFCVISVQPQKLEIPYLVGLPLENIKKIAQEQKIKIKNYYIHHKIVLEGICFAQYPVSGTLQNYDYLTVYVAKNYPRQVIIPSLSGHSIQNIKNELPDIDFSIQPKHVHQCTHCIVNEQKPLAGSIMFNHDQKIDVFVSHIL